MIRFHLCIRNKYGRLDALTKKKTNTTKINLHSFLSLDLHDCMFMKQKSVSHNLGRSCLLLHCFVMAVSFTCFQQSCIVNPVSRRSSVRHCVKEETKMKIHRFSSHGHNTW